MRNIIVLKCGGSTVGALSDQFYHSIAALKEAGMQPIIVHGGGPEIKKQLNRLSIKSEFVDGLRRTTKPIMELVEMVLSGKVNKEIVRKLTSCGIAAIGLSGSDGALLTATPLDYERYGLVGNVDKVNQSFLLSLLDLGIVPVIAPIAPGEDGRTYNINADTAAGAIARELRAKQLVFVTDVPGVMKKGQLVDSISSAAVEKMIDSGIIYGGMIPKVKAAIASLHGGLNEAVIMDGKMED